MGYEPYKCEFAGSCNQYNSDSTVCNETGGYIRIVKDGLVLNSPCVHRTDNLRRKDI